jgi:hypothetical protein
MHEAPGARESVLTKAAAQASKDVKKDVFHKTNPDLNRQPSLEIQ